jgi:hypothetical protein
MNLKGGGKSGGLVGRGLKSLDKPPSDLLTLARAGSSVFFLGNASSMFGTMWSPLGKIKVFTFN